MRHRNFSFVAQWLGFGIGLARAMRVFAHHSIPLSSLRFQVGRKPRNRILGTPTTSSTRVAVLRARITTNYTKSADTLFPGKSRASRLDGLRILGMWTITSCG